MPAETSWQSTPPDRDGFWLFAEECMDEHGPVEYLVIDGLIASDDEVEQETGKRPNEDLCENYWEGESVVSMTDGTYTQGRWKFSRETSYAR